MGSGSVVLFEKNRGVRYSGSFCGERPRYQVIQKRPEKTMGSGSVVLFGEHKNRGVRFSGSFWRTKGDVLNLPLLKTCTVAYAIK